VLVPVTPALWFPHPTMSMNVGATEHAALSATVAMNVSLASSDPSVVRVDPSSAAPSAVRLTAVGYGRATITATSGSLSAKLIVDVAQNPRRRSVRH